MKSFYPLLKRVSNIIPGKYVNKLLKIQKLTSQWHGVLVVAPSVAGLTIAIRMLGWLQPLELAVFDLSFRLRPTEATDERIVIVSIEESDLTHLKQWPLSDAVLAKLLTQISQQKPKVIGLDLYRDLPVEPGHAEITKVFKNTPNLIGIQKVLGDRFSSKVAPAPILAQLGQISANDVVVDTDGVLRRGMLFPIPGDPLPSLGLAMATAYLKEQGIQPQAASNGSMKLKNTIFNPFETNDGSYIGADAGGYQILLNFRGNTHSFRYVSVMDVLENRIPNNLMRDRIVIIGTQAASLNDAFYTAYSRGFAGAPVRTPGVEIQANLTSQILSSVLENRPLIQVWQAPLEDLWIFLWALLIASCGWKWRQTKAHLFLLQAIAIIFLATVSLSAIAYGSFLFGWWIPVVSPILAVLGSTIAISGYVYICRLRELNTILGQTVQKLEAAMSDLKQSQIQIIQSEKMSTLGQLVAGVAHEINNPVSFVSGNLKCIEEYIGDLTNHMQLYQQTFPEAGDDIEDDAETIDLEYLLEDMPKVVASMQVGINRIKDISISLRTFSRSDTSNKVSYNIHEGIDSTLMILKHRLKANETRPEIQIIKEYGQLPMVNCYPGQLNQVIMNLIANAIDALDESNHGREYTEIQANPNNITITTTLENKIATIRIKDNGPGMSDTVKQKIFEHLFTTKTVGQGTGLGLSISRQIIEETHGGKLSCISAVGEGAEFVVEIPS